MVRRSAARTLAYLGNNGLSEVEVEIDPILDLSDPSTAGLTEADLTDHDQQPCHALAAAALARSCAGLLVPSAALPGLNLVVLPRNLPEPPPIRVMHSRDLPLDALVRERRDEEVDQSGR